MEIFKCEGCDRIFNSAEGLDQHNRDKHGIGLQSKHELRQLKRQEIEKQENLDRSRAARSKLAKQGACIGVPVIIIAIISAFFLSQPQPTSKTTGYTSFADIPEGPIHWHPELEISINDQNQVVPANLGLVGAHQSIHTHDSTGTLHYENNNPTPENMPLRYFFDSVWRKQFNSTCIMNYCNGDSGTVKMFVNGKENFGFDNYIPRDKDKIRIEFA